MTVNPHLVQHLLSGAVLTETLTETPWWMDFPDDVGPDWHVWRSGEFPMRKDEALTSKEEPDAL